MTGIANFTDPRSRSLTHKEKVTERVHGVLRYGDSRRYKSSLLFLGQGVTGGADLQVW